MVRKVSGRIDWLKILTLDISGAEKLVLALNAHNLGLFSKKGPHQKVAYSAIRDPQTAEKVLRKMGSSWSLEFDTTKGRGVRAIYQNLRYSMEQVGTKFKVNRRQLFSVGSDSPEVEFYLAWMFEDDLEDDGMENDYFFMLVPADLIDWERLPLFLLSPAFFCFPGLSFFVLRGCCLFLN